MLCFENGAIHWRMPDYKTNMRSPPARQKATLLGAQLTPTLSRSKIIIRPAAVGHQETVGRCL